MRASTTLETYAPTDQTRRLFYTSAIKGPFRRKKLGGSRLGRSRGAVVVGLLVMAVYLLTITAAQAEQCEAGTEFCGDVGVSPDVGGGGSIDSPCWNKELNRDICNDPPDPCPPEATPKFTFSDDQDGEDDGQLVALGNKEPMVSCGTITVDKTGYYRIFDAELSESCTSQMDESGYLTIENSCNADGWAVEANVGTRYVVLDSDNTPACTEDKECAADRVCRDGNMGGKCCVPKEPTFMGTFLLAAGEKNKICLRHFCPEWTEQEAAGKDLGFVTAGCEGINSIHFRIDEHAIACEEDTMLMPCSWGCEAGKCLPDPCEAKSCPGYCKDGQCLDDNPCDELSCKHGCKNGRCLQPPSAPGPDGDGDGFPATADCDDTNKDVNPKQPEICANEIDDNCDGTIDEPSCGASTGDAGPLTDAAAGDGTGGAGADEGCGCSLDQPPTRVFAFILLLLLCLRRRKR